MTFARHYTSIDNELERIRSYVRGRGRSKCLVVGNGPSASTVSLTDQQLDEYFIVRCNWFFLEDRKVYGSRVDAFMWSIHNDELLRRLEDLKRVGHYEIGAYFQPFQSRDPGAVEGVAATTTLEPVFDHWSVIAGNPTLARFMMGRPLPTQGMQAMAFAAALGFKEIHVTGVDLYADAAQRYAWNVPADVAAHLKEKDLKPQYESNHSLDTDLCFLRALREQFDIQLVGISRMEVLAPHLDRVELSEHGEGRQEGPEPGRENLPRRIYATYTDAAYAIGATVLARSLRQHSRVPLLCLHSDPDVPALMSGEPNVVFRKVEEIANPHDNGQQRFAGVYNKLRVFELEEFDRVVFLDADCVVRRSVDNLFDGDEFLAAPDWGQELTEYFNSGVFAFTPSAELRDTVLGRIGLVDSYDGGDQGYLNEVLKDRVKLLPPEYNTLKRLPFYHPHLIADSDIRILHFVGRKPWGLDLDANYIRYNTLWLEYLTATELRGLVLELKRKSSEIQRILTSDEIVELKNIVRRNPTSTNAAIDLANYYIQNAERGSARAVLRQALRMRPERPIIWRLYIESFGVPRSMAVGAARIAALIAKLRLGRSKTNGPLVEK